MTVSTGINYAGNMKNSYIYVTAGMTLLLPARTHDVVVFDTETTRMPPVENDSLSNTTATYVLILVMHAKCNCVPYVLF